LEWRTDVINEPTAQGAGYAASVTDRVQQYLRETKPWVTLMSVLVFIVAGMMVLGALAVLAMSVIGGAASESAIGGALVGGILAIAYGVLALLYIMPGVYLWRYQSAIGQLVADRSTGALERALEHQRSFWRFVGILSICMTAIAVIGVVAAVGIGVVAGMLSR
jgi:hypothetical protein